MAYTWEGMTKISYEKALELFRLDESNIFMLHEDNTESLIVNEEEMLKHYKAGGEFGIEKHF